MANFLIAYGITSRFEGGIANNPKDRGGLTYKGIARNFWPTWGGWVLVDQARRQTGDTAQINKILAANPELQKSVEGFYKVNFWDINRLDQIDSQALANELYDIGVNSGTGTASKTLQEALNLTNRNQMDYKDITVGSGIGPVTLQLANKHPRPALLVKVVNSLQAERYLSIMRKNPTQEEFAQSWFSRV